MKPGGFDMKPGGFDMKPGGFDMKPGGFDSKILSLAKGVGDQGNHPANSLMNPLILRVCSMKIDQRNDRADLSTSEV